jgi:hypothetical protein
LEGLSWFNFVSLFLGAFVFLILSFWLSKFWLFLFLFFFLFAFLQKYFSSFLEQKRWREIIFAFLFWLWILNSYSFSNLFGLPFIYSLSFYLSGLLIFSFFYFLFNYQDFSFINLKTKIFFFLFILINLEFFWLLSFFSLPLFIVASFALTFFYVFFYYKYFLKFLHYFIKKFF